MTLPSTIARVALIAAVIGCAHASPDAWTAMEVADQPVTRYGGAGGPAFAAIPLPVESLRGRWARATASLDAPARATLRIEIAYADKRSFSVPPRCGIGGDPARCASWIWVPPDASRARLVVSGAMPVVPTVDVAAPVATVGDAADGVVDLLRTRYYRRDEVDWLALRQRIAALPRPPSDEEIVPGVAEYLRSQMPGNEHLFVIRRSGLDAPPSKEIEMPACSDEPGAGVVALPGLQQTSGETTVRYAQSLHDCLLAADASRPWVIDLRHDGGGNMYPMIGGLAPLLPIGPLYAFADAKRIPSAMIGIDEQGVRSGDRLMFVQADGGTRTTAPVVVVYGPGCASSCEQTANALAARPRTLFVGQPTGGYVTANDVAPIDREYAFTLTNGYTQDPCGAIIEHNLRPDVTIDDVDRRTVAEILAAEPVRAWLKARAHPDDRNDRVEPARRCEASRRP